MSRLQATRPLSEATPGIPYESALPSCEFAVSSDGKWLVCGMVSNDGSKDIKGSKEEFFAALWSMDQIAETGSLIPVREFRGDIKDQVTAAAISPDNSKIVTATRRGSFALWSRDSGQMIAQKSGVHGGDGVSGVFFVNESEFVSAGFDGNILRWIIDGDTLKSEVIKRNPIPDYVMRLRPSPDRTRFVTSDLNKIRGSDNYELTLSLWDNGKWKKLPIKIRSDSSQKDKPYLHDISWSEDGSNILYVHKETIAVLDSATLKPKTGFRMPEDREAIRGAFAPTAMGANRIATFDGQSALLWDLATGQSVAEFRPHGDEIRAGFSADRKYVVTGSDSVRVFASDENSSKHGRPEFRLPRSVIGQGVIDDVAFSPVTGNYQFASIDRVGEVKLWDWVPDGAVPTAPVFASGRAQFELATWLTEQEVDAVNQLEWQPDGAILAAIRKGRLQLWNLSGPDPGQLELPLPPRVKPENVSFNTVTFSKESEFLAAGGVAANEDGNLVSWGVIWSIRDNELRPIAVIDAEDYHSPTADLGSELRRGITAIAFNSEGRLLTGGSDGVLQSWGRPDTNGDELTNLGYIGPFTWLPGDTVNDAGSPHSNRITALSVSPKGQLVSADDGGHIILWPVGR